MAKYCVTLGLLLMCLVSGLKPAVVKTEDHSRLLVLLRWQSGQIQFVNSVTNRPVAIHFRIGGLFHDFVVSTDETTEDYYTNGLYNLKEVIAKDSTDTLRFCSVKGIRLTLGFYNFDVKDGCLEVRLLWKR
ncbi:MAG: hypothetical protein ACLQPD_24495 [Desulfomonilaceae bacterium]